jgi:hypothetical protein
MSKHTPGPWRAVGLPVQSDGFRISDVGRDTSIATVRATVDGAANARFVDGAANARLIAAAPELLEASRFALMTLCGLVGGPVEHPVLADLRAAIAKAEEAR